MSNDQETGVDTNQCDLCSFWNGHHAKHCDRYSQFAPQPNTSDTVEAQRGEWENHYVTGNPVMETPVITTNLHEQTVIQPEGAFDGMKEQAGDGVTGEKTSDAYISGLADAIRLIDAEWYDHHSTQHHEGAELCEELRDRLNAKIAAALAASRRTATRKGTP